METLPIYQLGDVELDPNARCVRREGREIHLREKTFQVLLYLVARPNVIVSKEELFSQIWDGTAVTDATLVQSIVDLRKALGDDRKQPRFLQTLPKVGYRYIGPIELLPEPSTISHQQVVTEEEETEEVHVEVTEEEQTSSTTQMVVVQARRTTISERLRNLAIAGGLSLVLAVLTFAGWRLVQRRSDLAGSGEPRVVAVMTLENRSGNAELDWLREGLADMLVTDLGRFPGVSVLGWQQFDAALERHGQSQAGPLQLREAIELAKKAHSGYVLVGSLASLNGTTRVDLQLYDTRHERLAWAEHVTADRPQDLLAQVDLVSLKLASDLGAPPRPSDRASGLAQAMTTNLEAYRYYAQGVRKALGRRNVEAIVLLKKAVELDPQFAMAYARIGYAYALTAALPDEARPYLERALRLSSRLNDVERLHVAAWYAVANQDFEEAIRQYRLIVARDPLNTESYARLCYLLQGEERLEEAVRIGTQGLAIDPDDAELSNALSRIYESLRRPEEAQVMATRYVVLQPNEANAHDSLGLIYQWRGEYEQAIREYERAIELDPAFEVPLIHLGHTYRQLGRYRDAIRQYERYIQAAPSDQEVARGYQAIAAIHRQRKDVGEAARVMLLAPRRWELLYLEHRAYLALAQGDLKTAGELDAEIAVQMRGFTRGAASTARPLLHVRGAVALARGRTDEALALFKQALTFRPATWEPDTYEDCLADAYLQLGRLDEAIAEYGRVVRINPNHAMARYHLAQAWERKGQAVRARSEYDRFLTIWEHADPDVPEIVDARGRSARLSNGSEPSLKSRDRARAHESE